MPVVGHLHGTELLMLEAIEADPGRWAHAGAWADRLRGWAAACERVIVLSETAGGARRATCSASTPTAACWSRTGSTRRRSVRGRSTTARTGGATWSTSRAAGRRASPRARSRYAEADLAAFADDEGETPVLLYVGRFTEVKRLPLLIEAYEAARPGLARRAPLVIVGGFPGEWEGEHPLETIRRVGAQDVFLAGWHGHDELPAFLAASDVVVLPSVREQFGQVLVEGMACGLPAIAVDAWGPADIVAHGETGWLVEPDDRVSLANALVHAVNCPRERARRGAQAAADAMARYSWPALAREVAAVYEAVVAPRRDLTAAG